MKRNVGEITPIILAGGKGTRLWPLSRSSRPKQFLRLVGELSLFQLTLKRVSDCQIYAAPIIVTNEEYRFMVLEQAQDCGVTLGQIILEPVAKNTAAAISSAAFVSLQSSPTQLLHVLPSDHMLDATSSYKNVVREAADVAETGQLVTFGVNPTRPETGYGYLEVRDGPEAHLKVSRFLEKPDLTTAEAMIERGGHFWNSGMFMFRAEDFLAECAVLATAVYSAVEQSVARAQPDMDFLRLECESFQESPNISVDLAIFEKSDRVSMLKLDTAWSDVGAWNAVWKMQEATQKNRNFLHGPVHIDETCNSLIYSERDLVVVSGMNDVAVIASEDVVYVGRLSDAQSVGNTVKKLKTCEKTNTLTETHRTTYRPWGGYSTVEQGDRFQVKRLFVKPGKKLSLQKHQHRSEHWIVVRGTAHVTIDGVVKSVLENESAYLPRGVLHRLENAGEVLLELIEVQTGSYLGEDDIIRVEDDFGRE